MQRLIPGKTNVKIRLFKNVSMLDLAVAAIGVLLITTVALTPFAFRFYVAGGLLVFVAALLIRLDSEPVYIFLFQLFKHLISKKHYAADKRGADIKDIIAFTGITEDFIDFDGQYYGGVIEIPPVEFRFFSERRRRNAIENAFGAVLRNVGSSLGFNIIKLDRPIQYETYLDKEYARLDELKSSFENGVLKEEEFKARCEVIFARIEELNNMIENQKVIDSFYYLVLFNSDKRQLNQDLRTALELLSTGEMQPKRLNSKEIALFLRYNFELDFDESELDSLEEADYASFAMPKEVRFKTRQGKIDQMIVHHMRVTGYPDLVDDAWMAGLMSIPSIKVTVKCTPIDHLKTVKSIDYSIQELQSQMDSTGVLSKKIELQTHLESLADLLVTLQSQNESLLDVNIYVSAYDRQLSELQDPSFVDKSSRQMIANMRATIRRLFRESNLKMSYMDCDQICGFIGGQVSAYDPLHKDGYNMPTNSIAAMFPWIYSHVEDENGIKFGFQDGLPVIVDFFKRDNDRVNSNMVIVGKSGSGKSFATKSILANLAAEDSKIFVLDPENEYTELAANLHGKFINVGNAQHGRLNPFHIMADLTEEEAGDDVPDSSYAMHMQFLEEFYRQILPDCDRDALEYLSMLTDRMYTNKGITDETNLSLLAPEDYPIFDDLYDEILREYQTTNNEFTHTMLRNLINHVSKFASGGRNAGIWNGPSTIVTEENFSVFNFQSLLSNRNSSIANAQMLLVLKYIDHEIIKNRDYNIKRKKNRKVIVVIDEAHVFIDEKYPIALDFMFQLAKRIRKYNGMQIVITQNIKDFVGTEEIARKSTAIINACQYSLIFSLAPNDMDDLCKLYEKAGGINEKEQEEIVSAPRGQAFMVLDSRQRTTFRINSTDLVRDIFENNEFESHYFSSEEGKQSWEDYILESRILRESNVEIEEDEFKEQQAAKKAVVVVEVAEEDLAEEYDSAEDLTKEIMPEPVREEQPVFNNAFETHKIEQPAAVPVVPEGFNDMLTKLGQVVDSMGRFSYDALRRDMKQMIEDNMAAAPLNQIEKADINNDDTDTEDLFNDGLFDGEDFDNEAAEDANTESESEDSDGEDEEMSDADYYDILELLKEQFEEESGTSPIEEMTEYGEDVITVTLDDLSSYIKRKNKYDN